MKSKNCNCVGKYTCFNCETLAEWQKLPRHVKKAIVMLDRAITSGNNRQITGWVSQCTKYKVGLELLPEDPRDRIL